MRARVFAFGVGYDVNSRLLDKLARECFGQSVYVLPERRHRGAGGQALQPHRCAGVGRLEGHVRPGKRARPNRARPSVASIPRDTTDLFAGDQLVLVGRYKQAGDAKITIRRAKWTAAEQTFHFPGKLVEKSADDSQAFIEKLWAVRRVGEIIDEIDLHGQNQELVNELIALATKHGILTPYTSFLADETANVRDLASSRQRTVWPEA